MSVLGWIIVFLACTWWLLFVLSRGMSVLIAWCERGKAGDESRWLLTCILITPLVCFGLLPAVLALYVLTRR